MRARSILTVAEIYGGLAGPSRLTGARDGAGRAAGPRAGKALKAPSERQVAGQSCRPGSIGQARLHANLARKAGPRGRRQLRSGLSVAPFGNSAACGISSWSSRRGFWSLGRGWLCCGISNIRAWLDSSVTIPWRQHKLPAVRARRHLSAGSETDATDRDAGSARSQWTCRCKIPLDQARA
jgi:hypothetical protein